MTGRGRLRSSGGASEPGPWHAGMAVFGCVPAFSGCQTEGRRHATHRGVHGLRQGRPVQLLAPGTSHTTGAAITAALTSTTDQAVATTRRSGERAGSAAGVPLGLRRPCRRGTCQWNRDENGCSVPMGARPNTVSDLAAAISRVQTSSSVERATAGDLLAEDYRANHSEGGGWWRYDPRGRVAWVPPPGWCWTERTGRCAFGLKNAKSITANVCCYRGPRRPHLSLQALVYEPMCRVDYLVYSEEGRCAPACDSNPFCTGPRKGSARWIPLVARGCYPGEVMTLTAEFPDLDPLLMEYIEVYAIVSPDEGGPSNTDLGYHFSGVAHFQTNGGANGVLPQDPGLPDRREGVWRSEGCGTP